MSTTQIVPQSQDTVIPVDLYMSFELSDKKWQLTLSDGRRGPSRYSVDAGDTSAVMQCIGKAKERCKIDTQAKVHSCYEPGRAGWCGQASYKRKRVLATGRCLEVQSLKVKFPEHHRRRRKSEFPLKQRHKIITKLSLADIHSNRNNCAGRLLCGCHQSKTPG